MKNITLAIDEGVLAQARAFAKSHGTTVNALVREHLVQLVEQERRRDAARQGLLDLMSKSQARLGPDYRWDREDVYEERMLPRHERPDLRGSGKKR
jgi:plasmid stability protein